MTRKTDYEKLKSSNLKKFESYQSGASLPDTIKKFGLNLKDVIKIDANENVFIDPSWMQEQLKKCLKSINFARYPDPLYIEARKSLADYFGLNYNEILVGNGSDDIFMTIFHGFIDQQSEIIVAEPTFSMYKFFTDILGGTYSFVFLNDDFTLNTDALLSKVTSKTKIMILSSPNNPTGNSFQTEKIKYLIENFNGIFILDEAYTAYSDVSLINWIRKYDNLIVIRTFSKSLGLAGLRVGIMALNKELADLLRPLQIPYSFNIVAQNLVPQLLKEKKYFQQKIDEVKNERDWLYSKLCDLKGLKIYPSKTNFILVRVIKENLNAKKLCTELLKSGFIIRDRSSVPLLDNCVRITVGTREINIKLLEQLNKILGA
ncbi:MAG: histidinol-phosphate transaminase [Candidatus Helarchaeota archaeon]